MNDLPTVEVLKWEGADHHTIKWNEGEGVPGTYALVPVDAMEKVWWCAAVRMAVIPKAGCSHREPNPDCGWRWLVKEDE